MLKNDRPHRVILGLDPRIPIGTVLASGGPRVKPEDDEEEGPDDTERMA
jgi:hypothetical protein